jgi:hypothetical protein
MLQFFCRRGPWRGGDEDFDPLKSDLRHPPFVARCKAATFHSGQAE